MNFKKANTASRPANARRPNIGRERGIGLIEIGLGLVIVAMISVGLVNYFSNNSAAAQSNQLASDLNILVGKVKSAYAGQYNNVTNAKLNTGGFFAKLPALTNNAGVVTTSVGGGTLTVAPGTVTTANDSVRYTITQIPDDACLPLVTALVKSVTTLTISSKAVKEAGKLPDPSLITCANDNNTLTFQVM